MTSLKSDHRKLFGGVIVSIAMLVIAGCGSTSQSPGISFIAAADNVAARPVGNVITPPPPGSALVGAWVNTSGTPAPSPSDQEMYTEQLESETGQTLDTHMHYYGWPAMKDGTTLKTELQADFSHGRIPVISWNCTEMGIPLTQFTTNPQIKTDLASVAATLSNLTYQGVRKRVFVRWFWEFNLNVGNPSSNPNGNNCYDTNSTQSPAVQFKTAWQYIYQQIAPAAPNVTWLWNPHGDPADMQPGKPVLTDYFPTGYVDWIGNDAYDTGALGFHGVFDPFMQVFGSYSYLGRPLPIMIAETGEKTGRTTNPTQKDFLSSALGTIQTHNPPYAQLDGFMYFDALGQAGDWRLNSAGITEFGTMLSTL